MVNNILKRLRERQVSSVNENSYSSLIGILINDAKREVEDSWDWSALRTTITATTTPSVFSYVLTGSQNNIKVLEVLNDTEDNYLQYKEAKWMTKQFLLTSPETGSPMFYSFNGVDNDGDTIVDVYPIPDAVETLRFNVIQREQEMDADADVCNVPTQPVLMLAYAKAIEERGEDGGVAASSAYMTATRSLNDAISLDAIKHPEELIWQEV
jgi:hypothetical protein